MGAPAGETPAIRLSLSYYASIVRRKINIEGSLKNVVVAVTEAK